VKRYLALLICLAVTAKASPPALLEKIALLDEKREPRAVKLSAENSPFALLVGVRGERYATCNAFVFRKPRPDEAWLATAQHCLKRARQIGIKDFYVLIYDRHEKRQTILVDKETIYEGTLKDDPGAEQAEFNFDFALVRIRGEVAGELTPIPDTVAPPLNGEWRVFGYSFIDGENPRAEFTRTTLSGSRTTPYILVRATAMNGKEIDDKLYLPYTAKGLEYEKKYGLFLEGKKLDHGLSGSLVVDAEGQPVGLLHSGFGVPEVRDYFFASRWEETFIKRWGKPSALRFGYVDTRDRYHGFPFQSKYALYSIALPLGEMIRLIESKFR
jgi:hypothetical protein